MAASDSVIAFSQIDDTVTLLDGAGASLLLLLLQAHGSYTVEEAPYTEVKPRNKHQSGGGPVLRNTGEGVCSGSMTLYIATFKGSAATSPYEMLTFTGLAASNTSTGRGDRKQLKMRIDIDASAASGATQRLDFNYCAFKNIVYNPEGADGVATLSFDWTDHEARPTIT